MEDDFKGIEKPKEVMAFIGDDAEETECVREGLLTFETGWWHLLSCWYKDF